MRALAAQEGVALPTTLQRLLVGYVNLCQPVAPVWVSPTDTDNVTENATLVWQDPQAYTPRSATSYVVSISGTMGDYPPTTVVAGTNSYSGETPTPSLFFNNIYRVQIDAQNAASEVRLGVTGRARLTVQLIMQTYDTGSSSGSGDSTSTDGSDDDTGDDGDGDGSENGQSGSKGN